MEAMAWIERLAHDYPALSYLATFVWTFFEGETFVLVAGFAAAEGAVNAPLLLLSAWLGSFAGDQCWFWVGRQFGQRVLARRPVWRARVDRALAWLERFDAGFILTFRFIYGIRNISSFALGVSAIGWRRFMLLNFAGAGIWAISFVGAGYLFGDAFDHVASGIKIAVLSAAALLGGACLVYRLRRRRPAIEAAVPD
jgi:membrane protein DedA with SNARE-associated domain